MRIFVGESNKALNAVALAVVTALAALYGGVERALYSQLEIVHQIAINRNLVLEINVERADRSARRLANVYDRRFVKPLFCKYDLRRLQQLSESIVPVLCFGQLYAQDIFFFHDTIIANISENIKRRNTQTLVPYFSQPEVLSALVRLTDSAENYDVTARLGEISCPTLIISAQSDIITPITEQNLLHACIKDSKHVIINDSGHASMYEQPVVFAALVLGFANQEETRYEI